ncbi:MAG: acyl carrier protein [Candidatus Zipacnadales bacterium]
MSDDELKQRIKELVVECLFLDVAPTSIADDENLMEVYNVDSVNLFEIVVALEEDYGISFEDEDFDVETFATVASIAELVERKRANA